MQSILLKNLSSVLLVFVLSACAGSQQSNQSNSVPASGNENEEEYQIITLLPRDAIPAIDDPSFLSAADADSEYAPEELVLGVAFNGDARAYSTSFLSSHEIVNDTVGGQKIAVTW